METLVPESLATTPSELRDHDTRRERLERATMWETLVRQRYRAGQRALKGTGDSASATQP